VGTKGGPGAQALACAAESLISDPDDKCTFLDADFRFTRIKPRDSGGPYPALEDPAHAHSGFHRERRRLQERMKESSFHPNP